MSERKTPSDGVSLGRPAYLAHAIDATAMKAFAHPLRMQMYEYLNDHGSATATMLAKHTGESTGQTSYHLRQLERHGFVTEDESRGTGRERWWKAVGFSMDGTDMGEDVAVRPAIDAVLHQQVTQRAEVVREWFQRSESETQEWQQSSVTGRSTCEMTSEETAALSAALMTVQHEHIEAAKTRRAAEGTSTSEETRRIRVYLDVIPLPSVD